MATTSKQDIEVRAQLAACCAGRKASKLAKQLLNGSDCIEQSFREFSLLCKYIEILKCYKTPLPAIPAYINYDANGWSGGTSFNLVFTFNFLIGGSNQVVVTGQTSIDGALTAMAAAINTANNETIAEYDSEHNVLTIEYPTAGVIGNGKLLTAITTTGTGVPTITPTTATFAGGVDEVTADDVADLNCVTEDQLQIIFENISKICNICFKPLGFTYLSSDTEGGDLRITEAGETRETESGDSRITE